MQKPQGLRPPRGGAPAGGAVPRPQGGVPGEARQRGGRGPAAA